MSILNTPNSLLQSALKLSLKAELVSQSLAFDSN